MRLNSQRLWRHVETDWACRCHVLLRRYSAVRFVSAHTRTKTVLNFWSFHLLWDPALLLSVFRSQSSGNISSNSPPRRTLTYDRPLGTSQSLCPFLVMCVALFPERYSRVLSHIPNPVVNKCFYLNCAF